MYAYELRSCCALQEIGGLDQLICTDAWNKREASHMGHLKDGENVTSSIAVVGDGGGVKVRKAIEKALKAKGWKYFASFPSGEGDYMLHLWGSKTFKKRREAK